MGSAVSYLVRNKKETLVTPLTLVFPTPDGQLRAEDNKMEKSNRSRRSEKSSLAKSEKSLKLNNHFTKDVVEVAVAVLPSEPATTSIDHFQKSSPNLQFAHLPEHNPFEKSDSQSQEVYNYKLTEGQSRRGLLADYENECNEILPYLYLGGSKVAESWDAFNRKKITNVVNCSASVVKNHFEDKPGIKYLAINLIDGRDEDIGWFLPTILQFINKAKFRGERTLIHCEKGISRSASYAIAFHMWSTGSNWKTSFNYVKARRAIINPNTAFTCNLIEIDDLWNGETKKISVLFRYAAHSLHDSVTPILKLCRNQHTRAILTPTLSMLDSRGIFVLRPGEGINNNVFIWLGDESTALNDLESVKQMVKDMIGVYVRADETIIIEQGSETEEFLKLFVQEDNTSVRHKSFPDLWTISSLETIHHIEFKPLHVRPSILETNPLNHNSNDVLVNLNRPSFQFNPNVSVNLTDAKLRMDTVRQKNESRINSARLSTSSTNIDSLKASKENLTLSKTVIPSVNVTEELLSPKKKENVFEAEPTIIEKEKHGRLSRSSSHGDDENPSIRSRNSINLHNNSHNHSTVGTPTRKASASMNLSNLTTNITSALSSSRNNKVSIIDETLENAANTLSMSSEQLLPAKRKFSTPRIIIDEKDNLNNNNNIIDLLTSNAHILLPNKNQKINNLKKPLMYQATLNDNETLYEWQSLGIYDDDDLTEVCFYFIHF